MSYSRGQLEETAAESSEAERRAVGAERELMSWKRAQFMEDHLGDEYEALIISVQKYGCFVELFEVFVEGLLPMAALEEAADGRCVYREHDHAIIALGPSERGGVHGRRGGRKSAAVSGKAWRLGDRVRVRAERVDPMRRRVEFSIAAPEQTPE
jgi:ribonuclease R